MLGTHDLILKMSHSYFFMTEVTDESINKFIEMMDRAFRDEILDRKFLFETIKSTYKNGETV